jgi:membrane protease YdiL (CAAX protease family)
MLMPIAGGITWLLLSLFRQTINWEAGLPPAMIVPIGLLIWLLGALPEEYGWRGYALGRLQMKFTPLGASLVLGVIWSLWHLPLRFIPGTTQYVIPFWEFAVQTIVLSILYTWLYNHTDGSVLIAGIFHTMGNITGALIPYWTTGIGRWVGLLPLLLATLMIIVLGGLKRRKHFQAFETAD